MKKVNNEIKNIKDEVEEVRQGQENAYQLAIKVLEQNNKRERFTVKCLLAIIGALLIINGYFAYQFTTTTVVEAWEAEQDRTYNFIDSEGNVISSDLSLEEMKELIELNGETESQENQTKS